MSTNLRRPATVGTAVKRVLGTTAAVPLLFAAMPMAAQAAQSDAQSMQQMQDQIQQLQRRVTHMQQQQEQKQQAMEQTEAESNDEGFTVGNTTFGLGGYIKLDAVYNFDQNAAASLGATGIVGGPGHHDHGNGERFGMTAKQTRLTITSNTPTPMGDVDGTIQFDFYGNGNSFGHSYEPRVRLAYFEWNNWTMGKAWSTFSDFNYGTTLNFYGPESQLFRRHAQIRYTFDLANDDSIDVALESPHDQNLYGADNAQKVPDFVMRYQGSNGNLSYQVAGVARYLRGDVPDPRPGDPNRSRHDSEFGYGLDLGGSYDLAATGTTFMLSANYGEGDGAYVYNPAGGPDAYADDDNSLDHITRYGYVATISQELSPKWTGNIVWGEGFSDDAKGTYATTGLLATERNSSLNVNLLYNVVDPLTLGVEYANITRKDKGTDAIHSNRMQMSAIYHF